MGDRSTAVRLFNQAVTTGHDKSNPQSPQVAFQLFSSAVLADPTWWQAHFQYGNVCMDQKLQHAAVAAWQRAMRCEMTDAQRGEVLIPLSWGLYETGQFAEAFEIGHQAAKVAPKDFRAHVNLSRVYGVLGEANNQVKHARKAVELAPDDESAKMALAFALLFDRQFVEGFKTFECRYRYKLKNYLNYPWPVWQGEPGRTVFLQADQGLGDTISFARFVEMASKRASFLHLYIQGELMRWFQHAFSHLPNVNLIPMQNLNMPFPQADYWTTFVSLPFALGLDDEQIRNAPNIKAPLFAMPKTWKAPDAKLHIGIAYAGSPLNEINNFRSIPVHHFLELYRVPDIQLYSLQVGPEVSYLHTVGAGGLIRDLSQYIRDVCDTLALLNELDLVICCESALGHIASAIEKPCWIPYSYMGLDYRIGHRGEDRLWAPKHRIFQQTMDQRWEPVFQKIVHELKVKALTK